MKILILFISFTLLSLTTIHAQNVGKIVFDGRVTDANSGQRISGVNVTLYKDGSPSGTSITSGNGKYELSGPPGHVYKIKFEKAGMVSKHVIVDVKAATDEDFGKFDLPMELDMTLFEDVEGVDFSLLNNKPIGKAAWNQRQGLPEFDFGYTKQVQQEVQKLLDEAERKKKEADEKAKAEAKKLEDFNKLMDQGNASSASGKYDEALKSYQAAQNLYPDNQDAKSKISETKQKIEEEKKKNQEAEKRKQYDQLIASADKAFNSKDYDKAMKDYNEALILFPNESHPMDRINEIESILDKAKAEKEAAEKKEQEYKNYITAADNLLQQKKYEEAKKNYQSASGVKPDESYPKDKIKEIDDLIAKAKENEAKDKEYNDLIVQADQAFDGEKYDQAKEKYNQALKIKADESHPKSRIEEINQILKEKANQAALDKKYDDAIKAGDQAMGTKNYDEAKKQFNIAASTKPNEQYPKDKIKEIEDLLKKQAENEELEAEYKKFMDEGLAKFTSKDYEGALKSYQKASELKPSEQKPKDEIEKINKLIAEQEKNQEINQKYDALMSSAATLFTQKEYKEAKSKYEEASQLKPDEQKPKEEIKKIDEILAKLNKEQELEANFKAAIEAGDKAFNEKEYQKAQSKFQEATKLKPSEQYPKDKIAEIKEILDKLAAQDAEAKKYNDKIKEADQLFDAKSYKEAIAKYQEASGIKPSEQYPKDKIEEIKKIQKELEEQAEQNELDKEYNDLVAKADQSFDSKSYDQAITKYQEASKVKPGESYPKDQIEAIKKIQKNLKEEAAKEKEYQTLITDADSKFKAENFEAAKKQYEAASKVKPSEEYPKEQIEKINSKMESQAEKAAREAKFNQLVQEGSTLFGQEKYEASLSKYEEAQELKPSDESVKTKISEIKKKLKALAEQKAIDEKYNKFIDEADQLFNSENYTESKEIYKKAAEVKPNESYPQDQIDKANEKLKEQTQDEKQAQYNKLIAAADKKFDAEDYESAQEYYERAVKMNPDDQHPKDRISEINNILEKLKNKNEVEEQYQAAIDKADKAMKDENFEESKKLYKEANTIKPSESYPQEQIDKINELMKNQSEAELEAQYQKIIQKADGLYEDKDYEKSITYYQRALDFKPNDAYPKEQIEAIKELMKTMNEVDKNKELEEKYNTLVNEADRLYESKQWKEAKQKYADAYAVKPKEYPQNQIDNINKMMEQESRSTLEAQYKKIIDKADGLFGSQDYNDAKRYYERALSLKPDDEYPRNQIKEINRLLALERQKKNGIAMTDYGKVVKNQSVLDGEALLLEAEAQRRFNEQQKITNKTDVMSANTKDWTSGQYDVNIEIRTFTESIRDGEVEMKRSWTQKGKDNELEMKKMIDKIVDLNIKLAKYDNDDIYKMRSMIETMNEVTSELQYEGDQTRKDNELKVIEYSDELNKERNKYSDEAYDQIVDTRSDVENLNEEIAENQFEGDQTRKDNELEVIKYSDELNKERNKYSDEAYDQIVDTRSDVENLNEEIAENQFEGDQTRKDNELEVIKYNDDLNKERNKYSDEAYDQIVDTRSDVENLNEEIAENQFEGDQTRKDNELEVIQYNDDLNKERNKYSDEAYDQIVDTRSDVENLNEEIAENQFEGDQTREESSDELIEYNDKVSESRHIESQEKSDELLDTKSDIEDVVTKSDNFKNEADKIRENNSDDMINYKDEKSELEKNKEDDINMGRSKVEDELEDVKSYSPINMDKDMANKLAEEYPQGITEQSFNQTDSEGLVIRVITRRIVVSGNRGDVYERIQSKFGLSYTKNNKPITEFTWSNDTEDASLVRHSD